MKLLAGETVVKEEFSWASRPSESFAVAVILYVVERSSCPSGFQLLPSAASVPLTLVPSAVVMVTSVSVPSLTVTLAALLMLALVAPFFGEMAIRAFEASLAAASSTWACDFFELSALPPLSPSPLQADSTSTPPSTADAAIRPLRRLLSVITRFSIVADSPDPNRLDNTHSGLPGSTSASDVGNTTHR